MSQEVSPAVRKVKPPPEYPPEKGHYLRGNDYSRRSGAAPFTVSTPGTSSVGQFFSTACACLVRVHAGHVGLVWL